MGVKVIDLYTPSEKRDSWKTSCFIDGVHLSSWGSKIVVDEILKVLKEAEWEPSLYWKSLPSEFVENPLYAHKEGAINADEWTLYRKTGIKFIILFAHNVRMKKSTMFVLHNATSKEIQKYV
ncbi:hypothetical protein IFM89_007106 [Coptis chinensis]|uniref:Uncharacterized protein n=1 Tax=Coptis chinensis TaxID=261450 RepID=A0A835LLK3_9MAGN|nr:hypothetical protein IFM89_007106 [Coptis chinensis]